MPSRKPAPAQLAGLVFLALLTLGTETLPEVLSAAGGAAWLCPLAAGAVVLPPAFLMTRQPLAGRELLTGRTHPVGAKLAAVLYLLWGLAVAAEQADRVGQRLSDDLRGSPLVLTAAVLVLAVWMAAGGLAAMGRAGQIFIMAVGLTFFIIVLFGLPGLRWDWLILWRGEDLREIPQCATAAAGELSVGLYALFLLEDLEEKGEEGGPRRLAALFPLLALGTLLAAGRLGPGLAHRIESPFFQMVSGLGFQGAFQRLEELVSALWLLGDLTLLALLLLCLRKLWAKALGRRERAGQVWLLGGAVLALTVWSRGTVWMTEAVMTAGGLTAGVVLTGLTAVSKKI